MKMPLVVSAFYRYIKVSRPLRDVLHGYHGSVEDLELTIRSKDVHKLEAIFSRSMKHLRLKRYNGSYDYGDDDNDDDELAETFIKETILERVASNLLTLELSGFNISPATIRFPRLSKLLLDGKACVHLPSHEILNILHLSPMLEYLTLKEAIDVSVDDNLEASSTQVALPRLRHFAMDTMAFIQLCRDQAPLDTLLFDRCNNIPECLIQMFAAPGQRLESIGKQPTEGPGEHVCEGSAQGRHQTSEDREIYYLLQLDVGAFPKSQNRYWCRHYIPTMFVDITKTHLLLPTLSVQ